MGSWFSSPSTRELRRLFPGARLHHSICLDESDFRPAPTTEELYAQCIPWFAHGVLKHYNATNPQGAEFKCPTDMKAASTGFTQGFIWYHLNFSARRGDNQQEMHLFFAELCYDLYTQKLNLETCTILAKPSRSSCAFCPEQSKIMHPSETEFVCGKEGQQAEFFDWGDMLLLPWGACTCDLDFVDGVMQLEDD